MNATERAVMFSSGRQDWGTPPKLYARLNQTYAFDYDAACTRENCLTEDGAFYPDRDGLTESWENKRVWCNPPYGRGISAWIEKAQRESSSARLIVMLVPARTDTIWWHDLAHKARKELLRGRLRFVGAPSSAPFPSALLYWNC